MKLSWLLLFLLPFFHHGYAAECKESTVFYIIRHGQTDWNLENRKQGHTDIPLNAKGRKEAEAAAQRLEDVPFDAIYSSDLKRAFETAAIIKGSRDLGIHTEKDLRERNYGHWEGRLIAEYDSASSEDKLDVEKNESLRKRLFECLDKIRKKHVGQRILVASHSGAMRNLVATLLDINYESVSIKNAAILQLIFSDGQWSICEYDGIHIAAPKVPSLGY